MRDTSHDMIIVPPLPIAGLTVSGGTGAANLLTPEPKEVWEAPFGTASVSIDLGTAQLVDSFFLGFTNATAGSWTITGGVSGYTQTTWLNAASFPAASDIEGARRHGFAVLSAPVSARYIRITISEPVATLQAGIVIVGKAFRPAWPGELGPARQMIDTGTKERLPSGGFGLGDGVVKAAYKWTFGDLSDAERRKLWALVSGRGERKPVLVIEDPAALDAAGDGYHYGLFERLDPYERTAPGLTRWALSMETWV